MTEYVTAGGLNVATVLHDLVRDEIAPGTGVEPDAVWDLLGDIVRELGPRNQALLDERDALTPPTRAPLLPSLLHRSQPFAPTTPMPSESR